MSGQPMTLSQLAGAVTRSWRWLVAGAVSGVLVGLGAHLVLPQTWSATTVVRVDPTGVDPLDQGAAPPLDLATEERVVTSRGVAGSRDVTAHAVDDSSVLLVTNTARTPEAAARGADVVARNYLADRSRRAEAAVRRLRSVLEQQDESAGPSRRQVAAHLARLDRTTTSGGSILETASEPGRGDRPGLALSCLAGMVLGLLLSVPLAALRTSPARSRVVVLDVDAGAPAELRQATAALADHVVVVRDHGSELDAAERWCAHLRSVGIPASVVRTGSGDVS